MGDDRGRICMYQGVGGEELVVLNTGLLGGRVLLGTKSLELHRVEEPLRQTFFSALPILALQRLRFAAATALQIP